MRRELERISRILAAVAIAVGIAFFGIALLVGIKSSDSFLFAVGVTVAIIPEGLLPTVTLSLAMGAQRMARRHALVRNLEAVETLGSTTYICTDKTGTLTQNTMSVVQVWLPDHPTRPRGIARISGTGYQPDGTVDCPAELRSALAQLARASVVCSTGRIVERNGSWAAHGDPMEAALDALAHRVGAGSQLPDLVAKFPFDARRRRMSVAVPGRGDHIEILVKGAPDAVLPLCPPVPGSDEALQTMVARGWRLLAIARADRATVPQDPAAAEQDLTLLGLVALEDPPRPEARAALAACRKAGVRVAMITGDHPGTAEAIARETGLIDPESDTPPLVLTGSELPTDPEQLGALLDRDDAVVARVAPEDKLRIAKALTGRGHVVAMTGDGVNDAPALRTAAIGVAMGRSGTDVAREAADLVLLDDNFGTIVAAIEQGRATYTNIRRFLTYHLTDNVAELVPFIVWALSGGRFPLALGVLQVLALDIGTDILPALALGAEPPSRKVLHRRPTKRHLMDRALFGRAFGLLGPAESAASLAAFIATFVATGWLPGEPFPGGQVLLAASGAAFTAVVLGQMANAYACRSTSRPFWRIPPHTNPMLLWALAAELLLLAIFLYVPPVAALLGQHGPALIGVLVALLGPVAVLSADSGEKLLTGSRDEQLNTVETTGVMSGTAVGRSAPRNR
jgi:magnesium-transporting ATPase (P-type)